MSELYIGLMSGTSMDGIDAALVDFTNGSKLLAHHSEPLPKKLVQILRQLTSPSTNEIDTLGQASTQLGHAFAAAVNNLLKAADVNAQQIIAIGSHGQNIRHRPTLPSPFTLQISDPNIIATETGITTVADFRRKDIALGGHGAPLTPAFHQHFMAGDKSQIILNIGGIANVTLLPHTGDRVIGFDTGPGNCLLDAWILKNRAQAFDPQGEWASSGKVLTRLLEILLTDDYFLQKPPKSTGTEYFNLTWLQKTLSLVQILYSNIKPEDVQRTLVELTAVSIINAINACQYSDKAIYVCGGGVHNKLLMDRLAALHSGNVASSTELGIDPDWVEAMAFAWFAKNTLAKIPSNLPSVTGASRVAVLGGIYYP